MWSPSRRVLGGRIGEGSRWGLDLGTAGVEIVLKQDLRREHVAQSLAPSPFQTGRDQGVLGMAGRVAFVMENDRKPADSRQPMAEIAGEHGRNSLVAAGVQRQSD